MAQAYSVAVPAGRSSISSARRITALRPVAILLGVSAFLLAIYIANSPRLDAFGDTSTYESLANQLPGTLINSTRMPGYPVLIAISSWLPGGEQVGLMMTQAVLIVASVAATYVIARAALGRQWMALVVAFVIATDVLIAGYVRVVMSETLATALTLALVIATLKFLADFRPIYGSLVVGLNVALALTRPEWAFLVVVLAPYLLVIAHRRGKLRRTVALRIAGVSAAVLIAVGVYCTANLLANGYFGLSSVSNVALMGKVKAYGMEKEAPPPYSSLVPIVDQYHSVWRLVTVRPFNDANSATAGEFARAVIFHDPVRYGQYVLGTAISTLGEHDSQFIVINEKGPFGRFLRALLVVDQVRYRFLVVIPALALAWILAAMFVRASEPRVQVLGVLSVFVMYCWLTTAAGTFGEFERLRMPVNPLMTTVLFGTIALLGTFALRHRNTMIPALGLIGLDVAGIAFLSHLPSTLLNEIAILALATVQAVAIVRWSPALTSSAEPTS